MSAAVGTVRVIGAENMSVEAGYKIVVKKTLNDFADGVGIIFAIGTVAREYQNVCSVQKTVGGNIAFPVVNAV